MAHAPSRNLNSNTPSPTAPNRSQPLPAGPLADILEDTLGEMPNSPLSIVATAAMVQALALSSGKLPAPVVQQAPGAAGVLQVF